MADETSDLGGLRTGAHLAVHEVIAYRAGELADGAERVAEDHLSGCLECRRLVHTARRVLREVGTTVKDASARANQVDLLLARLRQRAEARIARPQGWVQREPSKRFWLPMAGVLAVVILVALLQLVLAELPNLWHRFEAGPRSAPAEPAGLGPAHVP